MRQIVMRIGQSASEWVRSSQVKKLLNILPNTLQELRVSGKLNFTKVGRAFFYEMNRSGNK